MKLSHSVDKLDDKLDIDVGFWATARWLKTRRQSWKITVVVNIMLFLEEAETAGRHFVILDDAL